MILPRQVRADPGLEGRCVDYQNNISMNHSTTAHFFVIIFYTLADTVARKGHSGSLQKLSDGVDFPHDPYPRPFQRPALRPRRTIVRGIAHAAV
ncbi:MAG TPA: hypothetical protein VN089_14145, partial [Duganella sp.]|nr:hypothetical protein [Duganella sp.]